MTAPFDVVVVGGGPAGSTCARECAARGLTVALVDRAEFPRDKPCGGGVNRRAARLLPFPLDPVVEHAADGARFLYRGRTLGEARAPRPITLLTRRRVLDAWLLEHAVAAGVRLFQRAPLRGWEREAGGVRVQAGGAVFHGRVLVAADGAASPTARLGGIARRLHTGVAVEADLRPTRWPAAWDGMLGFDLGGVPGGFGWLFPKRDHLNVGVGGWGHMGARLRRYLAAQVAAFGVAGHIGRPVGHAITVRRPGSPLVVGPLLLLGDAAGLVDPVTGEGIYGAIQSGRVAAEEIARHLAGQAPDLSGYGARIRETLGEDLRVGLQLHDLVQVAPAAAGWLLTRAPGLWSLGVRILAGETSYAAVRRRLGPAGHGLELLARVASAYRHLHHQRAASVRRGSTRSGA